MQYFIKINSSNKAKQDIDRLMETMGMRDIAVRGFGGRKLETFLRKLLSLMRSLFVLRRGDILLMQYPYKKFFSMQCRVARLKGARTITLIHDLGAFRRRKLTARQEMRRLSHTDIIIAHNGRMLEWLEKNGRRRDTICTLGIFDYLSSIALPSAAAQVRRDLHSVAYAGGLGERKNAFLYEASDALDGCKMELYGSGDLDYSRFGKNIHHNGYIVSDDFISSVKDGWGLVWDGDSCDACTGMWGDYLRLNNPHKCSFYLRAGLPVIVWAKSAMASFIAQHGVGIAVDRLSDIRGRIDQISDKVYAAISERVRQMQAQLNEGYYFKRAYAEALSKTLRAEGQN